MPVEFVHLNVNTEFSLSNGLLRIEKLTHTVRETQMPAVAITDRCNLYGAVKFFGKAVDAGIKPIIGVDLPVIHGSEHGQPGRLTLLAKGDLGYHNLCLLITEAFKNQDRLGVPVVDVGALRGRHEQLVALSGAQEGLLGQAIMGGAGTKRIETVVDALRVPFTESFYVELRRIGLPSEDAYNAAALQLAQQYGLPVVATNSVQFLTPDQFENHEVRVCIHEGRVLNDKRRPRRYTEQQYLRTAKEMQELFADCPEALQNTVEISKRCNYRLEMGDYHLPRFPVPESYNADSFLRRRAAEGLKARLQTLNLDDRKLYTDRLEMELGVIGEMGFPGYFLIVADFILWAKGKRIPVGPGRGSGAGSLVAWSLGITELDPIEHGLLFERFLNPERVSLPDFDIDFCMEGRDRVIEYVSEYYGRDKVAQIITHGTMAARAVVRDVGRVMGLSYGYVDKIAKLVPFQIGMTLEQALRQEELLKEKYEQDGEIKQLLDTAMALEGLARNVGKHAGGVVIAPSSLTEFTPLYCERGSEHAVTQYDKDDLEEIGLVKFDFLGLRTLTIIDKAAARINACNGEGTISLDKLPLDDVETYNLVKSGKTTALFQLESRGMQDLIKRLQPDSFQDLVALVALYRPGPLQSGMVEDFIDCKHGRQQISYLHPDLEPILKPTYGVILYQEQVMEIARVLAGYSLGSADLLRRAMGKKKAEEMARQREVFMKGAHRQHVSDEIASRIFDLMEKFAGYGFNKSHSAAYALITYQTAWLKAHYPAEFMAASLSADMDNTDRVVDLISECREMGLTIVPPDLNRGFYAFEVDDDGSILYGLGAIKGIGQGMIEAIVAARESGGEFSDLFDFCERLSSERANKRALESLAQAGAMDSLGPHRGAVFATLPVAAGMADQQHRTISQNDLFGSNASDDQIRRFASVEQWSSEKTLAAEKDTLGLYFSGHPLDRYRKQLDQIVDARLSDLSPATDDTVIVGGLVSNIRTMNTRRGGRMAFITLDDQTARIELAVFSELFQQKRETIRKDNFVVVSGNVTTDDYTGGFKISADKLYDWEEARALFTKSLIIHLTDKQLRIAGFLDDLDAVLRTGSGGHCPVWIRYRNNQAEGTIRMGAQWRVSPTTELVDALTTLVGPESVELVMDKRNEHRLRERVEHAA